MMAYWRLPTTGVAGGLYQRVEEDTSERDGDGGGERLPQTF